MYRNLKLRFKTLTPFESRSASLSRLALACRTWAKRSTALRYFILFTSHMGREFATCKTLSDSQETGPMVCQW